jgi:hypothetical protein
MASLSAGRRNTLYTRGGIAVREQYVYHTRVLLYSRQNESRTQTRNKSRHLRLARTPLLYSLASGITCGASCPPRACLKTRTSTDTDEADVCAARSTELEHGRRRPCKLCRHISVRESSAILLGRRQLLSCRACYMAADGGIESHRRAALTPEQDTAGQEAHSAGGTAYAGIPRSPCACSATRVIALSAIGGCHIHNRLSRHSTPFSLRPFASSHHERRLPGPAPSPICPG